MRFTLECAGFSFSTGFLEYIESLANCCGLEAIDANALIKYIKDNESDAFYNVLTSLYPSGKIAGSISYNAARKAFISETEENIKSNSAMFSIAITEIGGIKGQVILCGADILLNLLKDEESCGEFDARISGYVESCFEEFVDHSKWHYGYVSQNGKVTELCNPNDYDGDPYQIAPILWFGPNGLQPIDKWSIKYGAELSYGWFEYDSLSLLEYLVDDCNDCFSTWYTAECDCWLPDMEKIIKACPVQFNENDSIEIVNQKMNIFFGI